MTTIGKTIQIRGDVAGAEDLVIEGRVEGVVEVRDHRVVITAAGVAIGDLYAAHARIEGRFTGNIFATEEANLGETATVDGSILSPRVAMAAGGVFNGSIDTTERSGAE